MRVQGLLVLVAISAVACGEKSSVSPTPVPTAISLSIDGNASFSLRGEASQLKALVTLSDRRVEDATATVSWSSSNVTVVTVTPLGVVTARGDGRAMVTATLNAIVATKPVLVRPADTISSRTPCEAIQQRHPERYQGRKSHLSPSPMSFPACMCPRWPHRRWSRAFAIGSAVAVPDALARAPRKRRQLASDNMRFTNEVTRIASALLPCFCEKTWPHQTCHPFRADRCRAREDAAPTRRRTHHAWNRPPHSRSRPSK